MTAAQMRERLSKQYASEKWRNKVAKMSDSQVFAVYTRLSLSGKLN